jgi:hypothetical protein
LERQPKSEDDGVIGYNKLLNNIQMQGEFVKSENCRYNDPDIMMELFWEQKVTDEGARILDYFIDHEKSLLMILTDKSIECHGFELGFMTDFRGKSAIPDGLDMSKSIHFFGLGHSFGIINGLNFFKVQMLI